MMETRARPFQIKAVSAVFSAIVALSLHFGCRTPIRAAPPSTLPARLGYTVQAGAFAVAEHARRLAESLSKAGLDAFQYPTENGLYKVRFGDFPSRDAAAREAERLRADRVIDSFFIVGPATDAGSPVPPLVRPDDLRERLAATAETFIGVDYAWGGTSAESGFDCSGLVRAIYRLNSLAIPRSVGEQYGAGGPVEDGRPQKGDLVFFSETPGGPRTHVGLYIGDDKFIHAPGSGKKVRRESFSSGYFRTRYAGSRSYLKSGI